MLLVPRTFTAPALLDCGIKSVHPVLNIDIAKIDFYALYISFCWIAACLKIFFVHIEPFEYFRAFIH